MLEPALHQVFVAAAVVAVVMLIAVAIMPRAGPQRGRPRPDPSKASRPDLHPRRASSATIGTTSAIESTIRVGRYGKPGDVLGLVEPGQHEYRPQPGLDAGDHVGVHPVADHHRGLRVRLDLVECRTHHQRVGLADEVRAATPVARVISAATEPVAGSEPYGDGPVASGLVAMNRAPPSISRMAR